MTDLDTRMSLTLLGQVTWAEPEVGEKCAACAYWAKQKVRKDGTPVGVCKMVKVHSKLNMVLFAGGVAVACPQFLRRPVVGDEE